MIKGVHEGVVLIGIKNEQALIKQDVYSMPSRAIEHELAESLAHRGSRIIDELLGLVRDTNVNIRAALLLPRFWAGWRSAVCGHGKASTLS
jgi:poly(A) polymerase Pap1